MNKLEFLWILLLILSFINTLINSNMKKSEFLWILFLVIAITFNILGVVLEIDILFWITLASMIFAWIHLSFKKTTKK